MESKFIYNRVLLKLSGEALNSESESIYENDAINSITAQLGSLVDLGLELAIVIGGGNIWRGAYSKSNILKRTSADYMGMLATVMNAIYLRDSLNNAGFSAEIFNSFPMSPIVKGYDQNSVLRAIEEGKIIIFSGGTGHPFFTTDTTSALRSLEIEAEALLKATKVDGIYTDDPNKNPNARRYDKISYHEALAKNLKVMDSAAFSICRDNKMPIVVFNFSDPENLEKVLQGDTTCATVVS